MTVLVSARIFFAASLFVYTRPDRPELHGVHIEPNPAGGVYVVATDTARMLVVWDREGLADAPVTIEVSETFLKFCVAVPTYPDKLIMVDGDEAVLMEEGVTHKRDFNVCSPRPYPYWRAGTDKLDIWNRSVELFNPRFIADFGRAADILCRSENTSICFSGMGPGAPALARFDGFDDAFGLLMPLKGGCPALQLPFTV